MRSTVEKVWVGVCFLFLVSGVEAWASARVEWNARQQTLDLVAVIQYSGPDFTPELARASTQEIDRLWNEPAAEILFRGVKTKVRFLISSVFPGEPGGGPRSDCAQNFVQIRRPTQPGDRSYYYLFGQDGVFFTSDELGVSTTAAHEFGHGLGLDHNDLDQREASVPGIMFARGTWVRPEFQWDPTARAGQPGGSVRPHTRRVRAEDVQALGLDRVRLDSKGVGCLGGGKRTRIRH